ncbi:MAG: biotin synthase, partial [Acidobacteriota bacterium]|nr:biotin synthase [Acidobacteriota bacterium]
AKDKTKRDGKKPFFAPAGQTTQMIVGATASTDRHILDKSSELYATHDLRRVYYSGFSPIQHSAPGLLNDKPPLIREHRLYQADWLMRFYAFNAAELVTEADGNLSLEHDPKMAWALRHRDFFPVDVNAASREALLRVPGLGVRNVDRIVKIRRFHKVTLEDLRRLRASVKKMEPFLVTADTAPTALDQLSAKIAARVRQPQQLHLFEAAETARTGEL